MSDEIPNWERPNFEPGGGDAVLFYALFGAIKEPLALSRAKYRSNGAPSGTQVGKFARDAADGVFASFFEGPFGALLDQTSPELATALRAARDCMVIKGTVQDPPTLNYLRDVIGTMACIVDAGAIGILDMQALAWWDAKDWRRDVFEAEFDPANHVALLGSEDERGLWLHTRGLRKFGRPDLSYRGVTEETQAPVVEMFNRLIGLQVRGGRITEGQAIKMDGIPAGTTCHHTGSEDDPDFNNVHVEISPPT
jgi:hypothetical protein